MIYPLVMELAVAGIPVAVTCLQGRMPRSGVEVLQTGVLQVEEKADVGSGVV